MSRYVYVYDSVTGVLMDTFLLPTWVSSDMDSVREYASSLYDPEEAVFEVRYEYDPSLDADGHIVK